MAARKENCELKIANGKSQTVKLALAALLLFAGTGCSGVGDFSSRVWGNLTGKTPLKAVKKMEDPDFPDERRQGVNELVKRDYGKHAPYTDRYRQIADLDADYTVRAAAIRALNRSRDKSATPTFINALGDSNELVRLEAAKALNRVPDENAIDPLIRVLRNTNENKDVRIAAAEALHHYKRLEVARVLVGELSDRDFGIAWQSRQTLADLTGQDLRYDESEWLNYLTGSQKPFG
jgi:hypothetical protein